MIKQISYATMCILNKNNFTFTHDSVRLENIRSQTCILGSGSLDFLRTKVGEQLRDVISYLDRSLCALIYKCDAFEGIGEWK